jgi:hypothetical protein
MLKAVIEDKQEGCSIVASCSSVVVAIRLTSWNHLKISFLAYKMGLKTFSELSRGSHKTMHVKVILYFLSQSQYSLKTIAVLGNSLLLLWVLVLLKRQRFL